MRKLSKYEKETIINWNEGETIASIWYQEEGREPVSLEPGMVIMIQPEVKHWHGAKADSWFSHIAVEIPGTDRRNEWLEAVSDVQYDSLDK